MLTNVITIDDFAHILIAQKVVNFIKQFYSRIFSVAIARKH